jgi:F-type H+-transporting ATPase subunit b
MQLAERVVVESLADDTARSATVDSFLSEIESMPARSDDSRQAAAAGGGAS